MERKESSLFLLAVKRLMNSGMISGNVQEQIHTETTNDYFEVGMNEMSPFLSEFINTVQTYAGDNEYSHDMVEFLKFQKQMQDDMGIMLDTYKDMNFIIKYSNKVGFLNLITFIMTPTNDFDQVNVDYLHLKVNFRLADRIIVLTKVKKSWFGKSKSYEYRRIPPTFTNADVIANLQFAIRPLFGPAGQIISGKFVEDIKAEAAKASDIIPSDDHRRKVYDSVKKMKVLVTEPALLKLLPTKWECFRSSMETGEFRRIKRPDWMHEN